jgi:hypothetical protein
LQECDVAVLIVLDLDELGASPAQASERLPSCSANAVEDVNRGAADMRCPFSATNAPTGATIAPVTIDARTSERRDIERFPLGTAVDEDASWSLGGSVGFSM